MTRVIQFSCPDPTTANGLIGMMVNQANVWSRLRWLTTDPEYVTAPFSPADWHTHTTEATRYWTDWDAVYDNLGDDGKMIADQFLKPGTMTDLLLDKALIASLPDTKLEIVDVADLVHAGYTVN
jgi:hypothetical protein